LSHDPQPAGGRARQVRRLRHAAWFALLSGLLLILSSCSLAEDITPPPGALPSSQGLVSPVPAEAIPPDQIDLQRGAALFSDQCAPCHGPGGQGDGPLAAQFSSPVPALAAPEIYRPASPAQWFAMVTNGDLQQFMPPFGGALSAAERWQVTYYALALGTPASSLAQASQIYAQRCASCHGAEGKGDGAGAKSLAAPLADLTKASTLARATGQDLYNLISQGSAQGMPPASSDLTEDQRWGLVAYVRSLAEGASAQMVQGSGSAHPPAASSGPSTVRVVGQVTNGTTQQPLAGQAVLVQSYSGTAPSAQQSAISDSQGNFEVEGVELPADRSVAASVDYRGVTYSSELKQGPSGSGSISLPVSVYDTTTDTSFLSMDRQHIFVESVPGQAILRVGVLAIFSNPEQKTVVASKTGGGILVFDLPAGARDLQFEDGALGGRYISTASGFADTQAVIPGSGSHQVLYSFDLPAGRQVTLNIPVRYPLAGEVIVVPQTLRVQSDQVVDSGSRQIQGGTYELYAGGALSPGQTLNLTVLDESQSLIRFGSGAPASILIGAGVLGLVLFGAALYGWRRQRSPGGPPPEGGPDRETLLRTIAALDDAHEAGELEEEAYRIRRTELKARLLEPSTSEEPDRE